MNRTHLTLLALAALPFTTALALLIAPAALHAQDTSSTTSPAPATTPHQTCGFEYSNVCGAPMTDRTPVAHVQMLSRYPVGCPVGFYAGHSNSLTQLRAQDAKPGTISQSLNLRLDNSTSRDIVSAQITLHGLSPHYRITPANANSAPNGDLSKQIALNLPVDAGKHAATDLRVYGFTSVQRIDLDSLTYADGTTWTASTHQPCSVVPNGLMLVAAAQ